ncbi:acyl-CoA oxidase [Aspergillus novoparasiticus]|uniref:Acyl-CoA oxidase n=1 Tax=Aspergillus novoparasiticus TaxID=986946 RepID=A0A5N6E5Q8_9EURO|nr:acyl-CoA oxidase [Aspergillus novoparasiticus]
MAVRELKIWEISHRRVQAIGRSYDQCRIMTLDDVANRTPKFWHCHKDGMIIHDPVAYILVTIQLNLVAGMSAKFIPSRRDPEPLLKEILNFDLSCALMLNEVSHSCDTRNLETTAILQPDRSFILNTPNPGARKFMPPSISLEGTRRIALVFALLIVEEQDQGIRAFISWLLPAMEGGRVLDHSITSFNQVRLPSNAILGDLKSPVNMRDNFLDAISRVNTGGMALLLCIIPFLKCTAFTVGLYRERVPILFFRTQQLPVLHTFSQLAVMEAFAEWATTRYNDSSVSAVTRRALSVILKVLFLYYRKASLSDLIERCGAQGMFPHNQLAQLECLTRGSSIAEGEPLAISIWLIAELLLDKYGIPPAARPGSFLAKHEAGLFSELKERKDCLANHRGDEINQYIIPHCRPMVVAIGLRMAYEAANDKGVDRDLLALYEAGTIKCHSAWFVERLQLSRAAQFDMECKATNVVLSRFDEHLHGLEIEPYCTAPILSSSEWERFIRALPMF